MSKIDLKVLVEKDSFHEIQDYFLSKGIKWDSSGLVTRNYKEDWICLYYRAKSKTIQYGIHKYNYDLDIAKEVTSDEFKKALKCVLNG